MLRCLPLLLLAVACSPDEEEEVTAAGTQIGVEHSGGSGCVEVSVEELDLTEVPPGFEVSVNELFEPLFGTFLGAALDAQEQPTAEQVELMVEAFGWGATLHTFEVDPESLDAAVVCDPVVERLVDVAFTSDLPAFSDLLALQVSPDGSARASYNTTVGFDGTLPQPTTFEPTQVDAYLIDVGLSAAAGTYAVTVGWRATTYDGQGEDGGPSLDYDPLLHAVVERVDDQ
jgi:hypothetical protein